MSITQSNQFDRQTEYELEGSVEGRRQPCQYCMDLKRDNFVQNGFQDKPFPFRIYHLRPSKSIECPCCNLIINGIKAFDDIEPIFDIPWKLRTGNGLVLKGYYDGRMHQLEFYVTPGKCRNCKRRNLFSIVLTTPLDRRREIANSPKLHFLVQTCLLNPG